MRVTFAETFAGQAVAQEAKGTYLSCLPPSGAVWDPILQQWEEFKALQDWRRKIERTRAKLAGGSVPPSTTDPYNRPTSQPSGNPQRPHAVGKPLHSSVIRGGPELYLSVMGTLAPVATPSLSLSINCLIDTCCSFSNFYKEAIARQLVDLTSTAESERRVVTLADGSTVSTVGRIVSNLRLTCDTIAVSLKSITTHILPELAFDGILGYPTIRRYNLLSLFYSLFCEAGLQVHNCKSCRQCLPAVFQQESSLASEETQAAVLLEAPRPGALIVPRDSHSSSEGGLAIAVIQESPRQSRRQEERGPSAAVTQVRLSAIPSATRGPHLQAERGLDGAAIPSATRKPRPSCGRRDRCSVQSGAQQTGTVS